MPPNFQVLFKGRLMVKHITIIHMGGGLVTQDWVQLSCNLKLCNLLATSSSYFLSKSPGFRKFPRLSTGLSQTGLSEDRQFHSEPKISKLRDLGAPS